VKALIAELAALSRDELTARAAITKRADPNRLGLRIVGKGANRAGEAVAGRGEGADGRHCRVLSVSRAAPIAASMAGDRPEAIDLHPAEAGTQ
jgi:hypothetical protein